MLKELVDKGIANWNVVLQAATSIMALIAGFVVAPPIWTYDQSTIWYRFAQFLVAVLIALMIVPATRWNKRSHTYRWVTIAIVAVTIGIGAFFTYQTFAEDWSVAYDNKRWIKGNTYTPAANTYKERIRTRGNREITDEELVMASAGNREDIWNLAEIKTRGRILSVIYVATILAFALAIVAVVQVLFCNFAVKNANVR